MKKIIVNTTYSKYPVLIGKSHFVSLPQILDKHNLLKNIYVVIDKNVARFHIREIETVLSNTDTKVHFKVLPSGERTKSDIVLKKIYQELLNKKYGRDTTLIAIGGGVIGDIAGYAAATYMRGINLVHVPTTFLAMIDSSIGGKTGLNFSGRKNIIGAFYQPELVFIDTEFLSTLPKREFSASLGELLKYGLISTKAFNNLIYSNIEKIKLLDSEIINRIIAECLTIKASVISRDEYERTGIRRVLNLGHTFAHAIESDLTFQIKHGEAVTAGIICSLFLSNIKGFLSDDKLKSILELANRIHLNRSIKELNNQHVYNNMFSDKKNVNGEVRFVLLADIGKILVDIMADRDEIFYALSKMRNNFSV